MTRIAIVVFRLIPSGGRERHAARLAEMLVASGARVSLITSRAAPKLSLDIEQIVLPVRAGTNHGMMRAFGKLAAEATRASYDVIVGFQKLNGLDVLFCCDWCFVSYRRGAWTMFLPRNRTMAALERACFSSDSNTRIIAISKSQVLAYEAAYRTPKDRIVLLPPTVDPIYRSVPDLKPSERTHLLRRYRVSDGSIVWLWVALQPRVKGLDRVLAALARVSNAFLLICGLDRSHPSAQRLLGDLKRRGIAGRVCVAGSVDEKTLHELYASSDLLVHPARLDVTGTVILEAMALGLPVVTTENCGYAIHVAAADAGIVLPEPFNLAKLTACLSSISEEDRVRWSRNARAYCSNEYLYSGMDVAASVVLDVARRKAVAASGEHFRNRPNTGQHIADAPIAPELT